MKITKQQLKRIIREEKQKLQELDLSGPAVGTDADLENSGDYSTGRWDGLEEKFEACLYEMQMMFVAVNGVDRMEANEMVLQEAERILGV